MRKIALSLFASLGLSMLVGPTSAQVPHEAQQMILVLTKDWKAVPATMAFYERSADSMAWEQVGKTIPAVVGLNGMGWGRGFYDPKDADGNSFREQGDKRSPAGIFTLSEAFGTASPEEAKQQLQLKWPYLHLSETVQCIGDNHSQYYNQVLDTTTVKRDWTTEKDNEMMRKEGLRDERAYQWGLIIDNNSDKNPDPAMKLKKHAGACIFMHIWRGPERGTAGCTATTRENMEFVLRWLDPEKHPILVQLPQEHYLRLKPKWHLP